MTKTLGLDLGTNSIGWAIVERDDNDGRCRLLDRGVDIFQEGVAREKNNEKPAVQDRTEAHALRRHYFRRRIRKIELLGLLVKYDLCPPLSRDQLHAWRSRKRYPLDEEFLRWQRTDDAAGRNPYHDRNRALSETLDLDDRADRHALGRALYHLAQRRGFLSNRKQAGAESEDGTVKQGISDLSEAMRKAGCEYLGQYFHTLYLRKEKIRTHYTARNEHFLAEFRAICEKQQLPGEWREALHRAIFYQRPLKSQKGQVGRCTFEKKKSRCPASHPRFEEFRMRSFINNIRIAGPGNEEPRPLRTDEIERIRPLFLRKSKPHFDFAELAAKLAGKGNFACKGDRSEAPYRFNFPRTTTVSGCPVTAALIALFGDDWQAALRSRYTLAADKSDDRIVNDIWHALFSFDDEERLRDWARTKLGLSEDEAQHFAAIRMPQDYASLSLNAIDKILPGLRAGLRYDEAVFMANMQAVVPDDVRDDAAKLERIGTDIAVLLEDFGRNPLNVRTTKEQCVRDYLRNCCGIDDKHLDRMYHPSMIETYRAALPDAAGILRLGSPRTDSIRNPMAMRALFRLRILLNTLLRQGKIDRTTKINIEFSRNLHDANHRKAFEQYRRDREAENRKYADELRTQYADATGRTIEPTETDILKFRLWKEQQHRCIYTGKQIGIADFIGSNPRFDIEHTVPRSRGGDDSQKNKTLCDCRYNREVKRAKLPSELADAQAIGARIEELGWRKRIDELEKQIGNQIRKSKNASTKQEKDFAIQRRHYLKMQLDYWKGKYERFTMTEVPDGFSNRQGVDIGIIGRYARLYLKSVFERIYTVKGATTDAFRKMWGLQEEYAKKERVNHVHHCIDAITIACIGRTEYDRWAQYKAEDENYRFGRGDRPLFVKPWPTFTEDVLAVAEGLLVAHHTPDNMGKQSRRKLRVRGRIRRGTDGKPLYAQGDTARGVLHQQTFYGAIRREDEVKYVVRKSLDQLQESDVAKIVDDAVRKRVEKAVADVGFKTATNTAEHTIWMNEEKGVPIRKVRIYTPSVTQPIHLKRHRDLSDKEYKQEYHVANDGNYCMAIYEGTDRRGKTKRSFELVSNLEAARYFRRSADRAARPDLVPQSDADGYPLKCILRPGTMVLFYENSPAELYECTQQELTRRLYKVTGLSILRVQKKWEYGAITFKHHQEARPAGELKAKNGEWKTGEAYRPVIGMYHTQLRAYVEGYDFTLSVTGEIEFKHRPSC